MMFDLVTETVSVYKDRRKNVMSAFLVILFIVILIHFMTK